MDTPLHLPSLPPSSAHDVLNGALRLITLTNKQTYRPCQFFVVILSSILGTSPSFFSVYTLNSEVNRHAGSARASHIDQSDRRLKIPGNSILNSKTLPSLHFLSYLTSEV